jgi:predicted kinase
LGKTREMEPELIVVTGIMAAGKSTVAEALARRFPKSVHLRGDTFRRSIVAGREEMSTSPTDEAVRQLRLRYRLAAIVADEYVRAGFTTVVQDIIIGPMLGEFVAMIATRPLSLVVLSPSVEVVAQRETARSKTGYTSFTPSDLDDVLQLTTPRIGLWVDSSDMTVDETVDVILLRKTEARIH